MQNKNKFAFIKLSNKSYDFLKWLVILFMPSLIALTGGLGVIFGYEDTDKLVSILAIVNTFFGSITGISSINFDGKGEEKS